MPSVKTHHIKQMHEVYAHCDKDAGGESALAADHAMVNTVYRQQRHLRWAQPRCESLLFGTYAVARPATPPQQDKPCQHRPWLEADTDLARAGKHGS